MEKYIYIIAPLAGWVVAQALKVVIELRKDGVQLKDVVTSGGMPSSHTAGVISLLTVLGIRQGIESPIFGVCFMVTGLVIYDAMGVRRTTGETAQFIRQLQKDLKLKDIKGPIHIARGHTPRQVAAGAALGFLIGLLLQNGL